MARKQKYVVLGKTEPQFCSQRKGEHTLWAHSSSCGGLRYNGLAVRSGPPSNPMRPSTIQCALARGRRVASRESALLLSCARRPTLKRRLVSTPGRANPRALIVGLGGGRRRRGPPSKARRAQPPQTLGSAPRCALAAALSAAPPPARLLGCSSRSAPTPMTRAAAAKLSKRAAAGRGSRPRPRSRPRASRRASRGHELRRVDPRDRGFVDLRGAPEAFMPRAARTARTSSASSSARVAARRRRARYGRRAAVSTARVALDPSA